MGGGVRLTTVAFHVGLAILVGEMCPTSTVELDTEAGGEPRERV